MQNTMRAHSAGQISIEGGVEVNKGHMVYNDRYLTTTSNDWLRRCLGGYYEWSDEISFPQKFDYSLQQVRVCGWGFNYHQHQEVMCAPFLPRAPSL